MEVNNSYVKTLIFRSSSFIAFYINFFFLLTLFCLFSFRFLLSFPFFLFGFLLSSLFPLYFVSIFSFFSCVSFISKVPN
jgi:hypothetical protein